MQSFELCGCTLQDRCLRLLEGRELYPDAAPDEPEAVAEDEDWEDIVPAATAVGKSNIIDCTCPSNWNPIDSDHDQGPILCDLVTTLIPPPCMSSVMGTG